MELTSHQIQTLKEANAIIVEILKADDVKVKKRVFTAKENRQSMDSARIAFEKDKAKMYK